MSEQTLLTPGEIKGYRSIVWRKMEYEPLVNIEGLLKAQLAKDNARFAAERERIIFAVENQVFSTNDYIGMYEKWQSLKEEIRGGKI